MDRVDVDIKSGEFTALIGPSGSGKTTLLMLVGCMEQPTHGRVIFEGVDTSHLSPNALAELRRHRIGFVFQYFKLVPVLSVYENVELTLLLAGQRERQRRIMQLLEAVGLVERRHQRPAQLSGGEQQRVAIARALATNPPLVLTDEHTGNLDSQTANDVLAPMAELNHTFGTTFLFATHDPVVINYAKRRIHLRDGRIQRIDENTVSESLLLSKEKVPGGGRTHARRRMNWLFSGDDVQHAALDSWLRLEGASQTQFPLLGPCDPIGGV